MSGFREQFAKLNRHTDDVLKALLKPLCHRTPRPQVTAYVPYTKRHALVQPFDPTDNEDALYDLVSDYLQRDNLQALPPSQRKLMTLILRKLLASSSFAIAGALTSMANRLKARLKADNDRSADALLPLGEELSEDYEGLEDTAEEWDEEEEPEPLTIEDRKAIQSEIEDLEEFSRLAKGIDHNAKGKALITALGIAIEKAREIGAAEQAIIFPESRTTQSHLRRLLAECP